MRNLSFINSFNAGQVSAKLSARNELPQFQKACRTLRNMFVLAQGGVESRPGSRFIIEALGSESKLVPFQFSRDDSYVIEMHEDGIRVFDADGLIVIPVITSPWTNEQIATLKHKQIGDHIYFTCPDVNTQLFKRTSLSPTFEISGVEYDYPPLLNENDDVTHQMSVTETTGQFYLESDVASTFTTEDVGKYFSVSVPRSPISITATIGTGVSTAVLDSSFSNWKLTTGGTWNGQVFLQRKIGDGPWQDYLVIGDTRNINADNFTVTSPKSEGGDTELRVRYELLSNNLKFTLAALEPKQPSVVFTDALVSDQKMEVTPITYIGALNEYTPNWSEGAFSADRGFPATVEYHENRLALCGSFSEPSTVYLSETDNFMTFKVDDFATSAIKVTPITNEPAVWMVSKGDLMLGTRGSMITVQATDEKSLSYLNLSAVESNAFGGSIIQALKTNETVVYVEAGGKKLREVFYSDEEKSIISRDLTILSDDIGGVGGFEDLVLQRIPDQIIWGRRADGLLAGLTYERSQDIYGWHVHDFGGAVSSTAVRPGLSLDELWIIVERDGGSYIEYVGSRDFNDDLLDSWFVDSGIESVLGAKLDTSSAVWSSPKFTITTDTAHGLSNGDFVRLTGMGTGLTDLEGNVYTITDAAATTFTLTSEEGSTNINPTTLPSYESPIDQVFQVTPVGKTWSGLSHLEGEEVQAVGDGSYSGTHTVSSSTIVLDEYYNKVVIGKRYLKILQPMLVDSKNYVSVRANKSSLDCLIRLDRSMGCYAGALVQNTDREPSFDFDYLNESFPDVDRGSYEQYPLTLRTFEDPIAQNITPFTGTKLIELNDTWSRLKSLYVIGGLPMPLTILSIGVTLGIGDG